MQQTVKQIPTKLNIKHLQAKSFKHLIEMFNTARLLIIILMIVNLGLIISLIYQQIELDNIHNAFIELNEYLTEVL
jgi:hypothetical protein